MINKFSRARGSFWVVNVGDSKAYGQLMRHVIDHHGAELGNELEGLIVCDAEGSIVFANAAAEEIVGGIRIGVLPDDYSSMHGIFSEDERPFPSSDVPLARAVLNGESTRGARLLLRRIDGRRLLITVNAYPLRDTSGLTVGAVTTFKVLETK